MPDEHDEDGALTRWSRRKRRAREEGETGRPAARESGAGKTKTAPAAPPTEEGGDPEVIAKLPDIESLDERSDFSMFLQKGVPEELRRRALRKLWRVDPVFAKLDGLNDYDLDYTDAATVVEGLKSLYKVGKGMLERPEEPTPGAPAGEPPAAGPAAPSEEAARELATAPSEDPAGEVAALPPDPASEPAPTEAPADDARGPARGPRRGRRSAARRRWGDSVS